MPAFQVVSEYTPSGDQPQAIAKLAQGIKGITDVTWFEMGMPEALWDLEAVEFGPLVVGMDTHQNSIYKNLKQKALKKLDEIYPQ